VIENDGFRSDRGGVVGASRLIDVADPRTPRVVSELRLQVHDPENAAAVAGDTTALLVLT